MSLRHAAIYVAATLLALAGPALAIPVTFEFSGYVTSIVDNGHVLGTDVVVGDRFHGTYTYESTVPDERPADPHYGRYSSASSVMHVAIGPFDLWSGANNLIEISDYSTSDEISFGASNFASTCLAVSGMVAWLSGNPGSAFSTDALPTSAPVLDVFSRRGFQIEGHRGMDDLIGFSINGVIVPEPSTVLFLLVGGFLRKWR